MLELLEFVAGATLALAGALWFSSVIMFELIGLYMPPLIGVGFLTSVPILVLYVVIVGAQAFWEADIEWFRESSWRKGPVILTALLIVALIAYSLYPWWLNLVLRVRFPNGHEMLTFLAVTLRDFVADHTGRSLEELTSESQGMGLSALNYLFEVVTEHYYHKWHVQISLLAFRWLIAIALVVAEVLCFGGIPFIGGRLPRATGGQDGGN